MDAPGPSASLYYRPELDVVCFLAFLFEFLYHTLPRTVYYPRLVRTLKAFAPVIDTLREAFSFSLNLFFTFSDFLIGKLLLREKVINGKVNVKPFYIRRILSILPIFAFSGVNWKLLPAWAIYMERISFGLYVYHSLAISITKHLLIEPLENKCAGYRGIIELRTADFSYLNVY
jgi:peptidoglycan/LPS O-acetylase OafA/YrhL